MAYPDPEMEHYIDDTTNVVRSSIRGGHKDRKTNGKVSQSNTSRAKSPQDSKRVPFARASMPSIDNSSSRSATLQSTSTKANGIQDNFSPTYFPASQHQTKDYTYTLHSIASQFAYISYHYHQPQQFAQQCVYHASILDYRNRSPDQQLVSNDSDLFVSYLDPHPAEQYALFLDLDTERLSINKGCVCVRGGEENESQDMLP